MAKRKQETFIKGSSNHRRTEGDYMSILLDSVTLDDWREVVTGTLVLAKEGDPQARAWLAQYLIGKPQGKAPTPLNVVVQQLNGTDPLLERLANKTISNIKFPNDSWKDDIKAVIAEELAVKVTIDESVVRPDELSSSE